MVDGTVLETSQRVYRCQQRRKNYDELVESVHAKVSQIFIPHFP